MNRLVTILTILSIAFTSIAIASATQIGMVTALIGGGAAIGSALYYRTMLRQF